MVLQVAILAIGLIIAAAERDALRQLLIALARFIARPFHDAAVRLDGAVAHLGPRSAASFVESFVMTIAVAVLIFADIRTVQLSLATLGFSETAADPGLSVGFDRLCAAAFVAMLLVHGHVIVRNRTDTDSPATRRLGRPSLWRWYQLVAGLHVMVLVCTLGLWGVWRGNRLYESVAAEESAAYVSTTSKGPSAHLSQKETDTPIPTQSWIDQVTLGAVMVALSVMTGTTSVLGMPWVFETVEYLIAMVLAILAWPLHTVAGLVAELEQLAERLLGILADIGLGIVRNVWPPLAALRDAFHEWVFRHVGVPSGASSHSRHDSAGRGLVGETALRATTEATESSAHRPSPNYPVGDHVPDGGTAGFENSEQGTERESPDDREDANWGGGWYK